MMRTMEEPWMNLAAEVVRWAMDEEGCDYVLTADGQWWLWILGLSPEVVWQAAKNRGMVKHTRYPLPRRKLIEGAKVYGCSKCGHRWLGRIPGGAKRCPNCGSYKKKESNNG